MAKLKKGVFEERKRWFEENHTKFNSMKEMTDAFNEYFGLNLKESGVSDYFYKRLKMKFERYVNYASFTKEQEDYLKENYYKYKIKELTKKINEIFKTSFTEDQIYNKLANMKLSYRKANGLTFGETHGKLKVGDLIFNEKRNACFIKIHTNKGVKNYVNASRYFYEKLNDVKLSEDDVVFHLDGDKKNFSKENLKLISRKEQGNIMTFGVQNDIKCYGQGKLTEAIISVVRLETLVKNMEKGE